VKVPRVFVKLFEAINPPLSLVAFIFVQVHIARLSFRMLEAPREA
jgi:hypothetical protein